MTRIFYAFLLLGLSCNAGFSQIQERQYFDKDGRKTDEAHSFYYKLTELFDDDESVTKTFYSASGNRRSEQSYKRQVPVRGKKTEWHDNGQIKLIDSVGLDDQYMELVYYPTGKPQKKIIYPKNANQNEMIMSYWDSLGNQIVKDGNGVCKCYTELGAPGIHEDGKLIVGNKDGIWNTYKNDTLLYTDEYVKGKFMKGTSFRNGLSYQYNEIGVKPAFVGGTDKMLRFIQKHTVYPKVASRNKVSGRVFVEFIVEKDGTISNVATIKGISPECDAESERVVKSMPKWKPGFMRGRQVRVKYVLPINFQARR